MRKSRVKRRWMKVAPYEVESISNVPALASPDWREWRECARWVVMFGVEFAEVFAVQSPDELVA